MLFKIFYIIANKQVCLIIIYCVNSHGSWGEVLISCSSSCHYGLALGMLKEQGRLLREDEFHVWQGKGKKEFHL